jgi:hypothetical protein
MRAYFDTNVVNNIHDFDGISPPEAAAILSFASAGTLLVAASHAVAEELMQTAAKNPQRATSLGVLYGQLIEGDRILDGPLPLILAAVRAYASGEPEPTPFKAASEDEMLTFRLLTACLAPPPLIESVLREVSDRVEAERQRMRVLAPAGQAYVSEELAAGAPQPSLEDLWSDYGKHYAANWAERASLLAECEEPGLDGLLDSPTVRAAVGFQVVQMHEQLIKGRRPDRGDWYDFQHVVCAAASRSILITNEKRLRERVSGIPGRPVDVLTLAELTALLTSP